MINIFDAFPMVVTCFYFMFISKNWVHLSLFFCILSYVALIAALICPESPRWLLVSGRSSEAIEALNKIAQMNKVSSAKYIPANALFVEDPTNLQALVEGSEKRSRLTSNIGGDDQLDNVSLQYAIKPLAKV